ncbi:hypothetical protein QJ041_01165 [Olsenella sp. YH-ols2216]|nr:hypothetical protein [Olsenella sp. YH-ols2216]
MRPQLCAVITTQTESGPEVETTTCGDAAFDASVRVCLAFANHLIGVHPNDNTATVWMQASALIRLVRMQGSEVDVVEL